MRLMEGSSSRLMGILRARLAESGWNDTLYAYCRGIHCLYVAETNCFSLELIII